MDESVVSAIPEPDESLCQRLVEGDGAAMGTVYDVFGGLVFAIALRVTQNEQLAEDVTQEVFVELWQRPERFDPARGRLRTYLGVLARNRAVDHVRSQASRSAREERFEIKAKTQPTIEEAVLANLDGSWVRESVAKLPTDQRRCLELAYFGGLSYRDVASRLGIAEGTAKSRIRIALQRLRSADVADRSKPMAGRNLRRGVIL